MDFYRLELLKNAANNGRFALGMLFVLGLFKSPVCCLLLIFATFSAMLLDLLPGLHPRIRRVLWAISYGFPAGAFVALVYIFMR